MAVSQEPLTMDPAVCVCDPGTEQEVPQVFDTLVEAPVGPFNAPAPGVAYHWSNNANYTSFTFDLRHTEFSNGEPLTSADVAFSFGRLLKPTAPLSALWSFIKSVTPEGPYKVVIQLKHPVPSFYAWLTMVVGSIEPERYVKKVGATYFASHPIGSGAFEVASWTHGNDMVLRPNPHYWKTGLPHLAKVVINFVPDDNARVLDVRSGATSVASEIPFSQLNSLAKTAPDYHLLIAQVGAEAPILLNELYKPLANQNVRLALNYATPRNTINRVAFAGRATLQDATVPIQPEWDGSLPPIPYDLTKAKELLAATPYAHGFPLTLEILGTDTSAQSEASVIQQAWAQIGVRVSIRPYSFSALATKFTTSAFQSLVSSAEFTDNTDLPSASELAYEVVPTDTHAMYSYYNDPTATHLVNVATSTIGSPAQVKAGYRKLAEVTRADPPWVQGFYIPARAAVRNTVHDFGYTAVNWWRLDQVWIGG